MASTYSSPQTIMSSNPQTLESSNPPQTISSHEVHDIALVTEVVHDSEAQEIESSHSATMGYVSSGSDAESCVEVLEAKLARAAAERREARARERLRIAVARRSRGHACPSNSGAP